MQVRIMNDSVEITGYVNAVERNSKPLMSRIGRFIERICKGAFSNALERNDDVHVLLNHDWNRDLGSTKQGNLELTEDSIGLHARATICDPEVIEKARSGDLVGWSFGFTDRDVTESREQDLPLRVVKDLDLYEVSILDRTKVPAYDGTLLMARSEDTQFYGEPMVETSMTLIELSENDLETREEEEQPKAEPIDYSKYENMITEMRED